jgi:hypothetical protein
MLVDKCLCVCVWYALHSQVTTKPFDFISQTQSIFLCTPETCQLQTTPDYWHLSLSSSSQSLFFFFLFISLSHYYSFTAINKHHHTTNTLLFHLSVVVSTWVTFFIYLHLGPIKLQFLLLISLHYSKNPSGFLQILSDLFVFMTVSFLR